MSSKRPPLPEALGVPVTDAHTHLDDPTDAGGLPVADALALAAEVGVRRVVDVGCDIASSRQAVVHAEDHEAVVASVALHPNDAARAGDALDEQLRTIEALCTASARVRAVGETGLDYFRTTDADAQRRQKLSFAAHIALAKAYDKALVIHDRDAHDDVVAMLDAEGWPTRVQFHCFSGDAAFARRCLDAGAYLSFPGTVTYKGNDALVEALRITPLDRILVETDAPYLTPVPHRGKRNSSYVMPYTVRFLAQARGDDLDTLCAALDANATALFGDWGAHG